MKQSTELELKEQASSIDLRMEPPSSAEFLLATMDLLSRHRRMLVRLTVGALVVFTGIAFLIPNRYEAGARLMPPDQSSTGAAMLGALTAKGGDLLGAVAGEALGLRTSGAAVIGILTSRTVQDDLINQFDLRKIYWRKRYEDTRKILEKRTGVGEDKKSGIITITVQDSSPQRAANMARAYIDDLNRRVSQLTTSSAHRERIFLEERLKAVKAELDLATLQLSRFSSKNMTFDPQIQGKAMLEAAATLQGQLIAAESELSGLEQIYGPENPRVKAVAARAGELRSKLRSLSGEGASSSDTRGQIGPSLEQLPLLGNTYYDLARQAKISEAVYEALTKQYELAKVQEAKEIPSIKVLDEPVVPERKAWPPRLLIIAFGTLMTFLLGVICLYGKDRMEHLPVDDSRRVLVDRLLGGGLLRE
jgi:capsule polysaccharide export protein KpsE/RkpR